MSYSIEITDIIVRYKLGKKLPIKSLFKNRIQNQGPYIEALKGVSFKIAQGEILGIVGRNGSGKSTLLKTLAGVFAPDEGNVDMHGQKVSLLSLGVGFKSELTGTENVFLSGLLMGFTTKEIECQMDDILDFAEIGDFINAPVKTYSSGMYSKLAFAVAVSLRTEILLIDEVLSVGDEHFRVKSFNRIKEMINDKERTVVIVSHDVNTLKEICDSILWLHDGEIRDFGSAERIIAEYKEFMA